MTPHIFEIPQENFFSLLTKSTNDFVYRIKDNHLLEFEQDNEKAFLIRLPLSFPPLVEDIQEYMEKAMDQELSYLMLLIQAGHASLGYFYNDELVLHKCISRYMVRGNGKAQVTYLKKKGKSKAGSRIRLAQTVDFFEKINEKVEEWAIIDECDALVYSASIQFWNLLFESKVQPLFEKNDEKLRMIPFDVRTPSFEEMERIHEKGLSAQVLLYKPALKIYFSSFTKNEL